MSDKIRGKIMLKTNNKMIYKALILAILLMGFVLVSPGSLMAQAKTIAGEWDAAMNTPGGVRNFKIVFKVEGEKVTGTVKRATGDVALVGTIKGNDLQFSYVVRYNDNDLTLSMTGKVDGDSIAGTVAFGESGQSDQWSAKRAPAPKSTDE
jgi:hypothetical protein